MSIFRQSIAGIPLAFLLASLAQGAELPLAILDISPDSGSSPLDGITASTALRIRGQGQVGGQVGITIDGKSVGVALVGPDGSWTCAAGDTTPLTHGQHVLTASVGGGVGLRTSTYTIMVDTRAPGAPTFTSVEPDTGSSATDWITSNRNVLVRGRSEAGSTISLRLGDAALADIPVSTTGDWSMQLAELGEGAHNLSALATDAAGNVSATATRVLRIDSTPPAAPLIATMSNDTGPSTTDRVTRDVTPTLGGTTEAGASVTLMVDGVTAGTVKAGSTGAWSLTTAALADGTHQITAIATDAAGLASPASAPFAVVIKTTAFPPSIGFSPDTGADGDSATSATALVFSGYAGDGVRMAISLDGKVIGSPTPIDGRWTLDWTGHPIEIGTHAVVATATDLAGNQTAAVLNLTIDSTPPAAPVGLAVSGPLGPQQPISAGQTVTISGLSEPGGLVTVVLDDTAQPVQVQVDATGQWQVQQIMPGSGDHVISAVAIDPSGNVSAPATITVHVVANAPGSVVTIRFRGIVTTVNDPSLSLGGRFQAGQTVTGSYTFQLNTPDVTPDPAIGTYRFTAPGQGVSVAIGAYVFASDPFAPDFLMQMVNDYNQRDNYLFRSYRNTGLYSPVTGPVAIPIEHISWQLDDPSMRALTSDLLTGTPPDLNQWQSTFGLDVMGGRGNDPINPSFPWNIRATIQTAWIDPAVPAPAPAMPPGNG